MRRRRLRLKRNSERCWWSAARTGCGTLAGVHKLLTIGADADTKNREARRVDFNAELGTHLKAM
jgi:hypothetical protein